MLLQDFWPLFRLPTYSEVQFMDFALKSLKEKEEIFFDEFIWQNWTRNTSFECEIGSKFFFSKITIKVLSFYFMAQIFSQICDKFLNEDRCWCSFVWTRWRHQNFKETDIDQFSSAKIHSRKRLVWYNAFLLIFVCSSVLILVYESSSHVRPPQRTPNLIIVWCQRVKYKIQS